MANLSMHELSIQPTHCINYDGHSTITTPITSHASSISQQKGAIVTNDKEDDNEQDSEGIINQRRINRMKMMRRMIQINYIVFVEKHIILKMI